MQFMKFEDLLETSSLGRDNVTTSERIPVPELPRLHEDVRGSMFFCWSDYPNSSSTVGILGTESLSNLLASLVLSILLANLPMFIGWGIMI